MERNLHECAYCPAASCVVSAMKKTIAAFAPCLMVHPAGPKARQAGAAFPRAGRLCAVSSLSTGFFKTEDASLAVDPAQAQGRQEIRNASEGIERETHPTAKSGRQPSVSVVVPTCGRAELLNRCLQALLAQDLPPLQYEVLIVDDAPAAATREIVQAWIQQGAARGLAVHYLANTGPHGPAAARNRGWRASRAPIVAFTDDDTVPAPNWLAQGLAAFTVGEKEGKGADVVCGRVQMPLAGTPTDYESDAQQFETAEFVTANCLCTRSVLEALEGFDEDFRMAWREDSDLHFRLLKHGARVVQAADALVVHPVRPASWGVSLSQQKKIQFDALLYKKHPKLYRQRIRATPRWDYYLIVAALLVAVAGMLFRQPWLLVAGAGVWLAMTAVFCLQRLRGKARNLSHVLEMAWTSAWIPPLAVFWRMVGAWKFRVPFA